VPPTPFIKICGITHLDDALSAIDAGADALGFVFYSNSPRRIDPERAGRIIDRLPGSVSTVGVFVNAPADEIRAIQKGCNLTFVQLHGEEPPEEVLPFAPRAIKAFRMRGESDLGKLPLYPVYGYLLDAYVQGIVGGTGKSFEWALAKRAKAFGRIILAGGLTPENVREAIRTAAPDGLDVSSGVEIRPGKKDVRKLNRFIREARKGGKA
jgi:phosphoribosylanthranilate isomerase